jgi:hypothetical protein
MSHTAGARLHYGFKELVYIGSDYHEKVTDRVPKLSELIV